MIRAFKYRLYPTRRQAAELEQWLESCRVLYNTALEQRISVFHSCGKSLSYVEQAADLTALRGYDESYKAISCVVEQDSLRRLDKAFMAFYSRVKHGEFGGFPRFRGKGRYNTLGMPIAKIADNRLSVPNLGYVKFRKYRPLRGKVRCASITYKNNRWWVSIICDLGFAPQKSAVRSAVGIDMGLTSFATLSNGDTIPNPRFYRHGEAKLAKRQQPLSRKQKGSKSRERAKVLVGRAYEHIHNQRLDHARKTAAVLYSTYDLIAHEDLNIKGMIISNDGRLAKSINDAAWRQFICAVQSKAEYAGKYAIAVNPRGTTQRCSGCQQIAPKTLAERNHLCPQCGLALGRDHNAARNILALGESVAAETSKTWFAT